MKALFRITIVIVVAVSLISMFTFPANAYCLLGHKLIGGIRNRYYYIDSSVSGYWSTPYYNAINCWYNTNTYHAFAKTTTRSNAQVIMQAADDEYGSYGFTEYCSSSGSAVYPFLSDWSYCYVTLCTSELQNTTSQFDTSVACHELGHTCGLDENNTNVNSIMCQAAYGRVAMTPQTDDCNGLNYLYPNGYYNP